MGGLQFLFWDDMLYQQLKVGADLIEIVAPEIGNVLAGRKKFKLAATDVGKKTSRKQLWGGKPRKRRIVQKRSPKISRRRQTRKDNFSKLKWKKTRSTNDSNFHYGHFTNSCLEIFDKIAVLEPIESSHIQKVYASTSLDESSIEIEFETDRSIYLDMRNIHSQIKLGLQFLNIVLRNSKSVKFIK